MRTRSSDEVLASYAAFCRKYGDHTTGVTTCRCWNEQIIEGMAKDLAEPWKRLRSLSKDFFQRRSGIVEQTFEEALHPLQAIDRNVEALLTTVPH